VAIKIFYCENVFITDPGQTEGYWICYIGHMWGESSTVDFPFSKTLPIAVTGTRIAP